MAKPMLISGIQPSGKLHLGNYLGALKNFVALQKSGNYQCLFFIADLHSLTETYDPEMKPGQILDLAASYLALGLDPKKSTLFVQSQVPQTTELAWILGTLTPFGELRRMTQFKDKAELQARLSGRQEENVNVGLFTYPVLMAADILLYDAAFVPVGEDQLQHLELARTLARKFNSRFGKTFVEPKPLMTSVPRLMSLADPMKKMSKSQPDGCLFLDDEPDAIEAKLKRTVTDSGSEVKYDEKEKPGISNLLRIMSALSGKQIPELEKAFAGENYSEFKHALADLVADHFAAYRKKKTALNKNLAPVKRALAAGQKKAAKLAAAKLAEVKKKIGLVF
ncbi:MAG: tryptophan--tRNA ligase [Candidatus Harrisonbacteria bacterium]|nr:tryptophan--tRNA ligase [Candidatus Harrisonbacteria bacterium]